MGRMAGDRHERRIIASRSAPPRPVAQSSRGSLPSALLETLVLTLLALLAFREIGSLDIGFHLKAGEYILGGNG